MRGMTKYRQALNCNRLWRHCMYSSKYLIPEWRTAEKKAMRDGVGEGLLKIADNEEVLVHTADLAGSTRVESFREEYPERFFDVGVSEQNMAEVAAGLSF